jgi:hypothetical protein
LGVFVGVKGFFFGLGEDEGVEILKIKMELLMEGEEREVK